MSVSINCVYQSDTQSGFINIPYLSKLLNQILQHIKIIYFKCCSQLINVLNKLL